MRITLIPDLMQFDRIGMIPQIFIFNQNGINSHYHFLHFYKGLHLYLNLEHFVIESSSLLSPEAEVYQC